MKYIHEPFNVRIKQLPWQAQGLQQTRSGYGKKLTTVYQIQLPGEKLWRRVYAICFSNSATHYVIIKGVSHYIAGSFWHLDAK